MRLSLRPHEVYRVYGEEEFLAALAPERGVELELARGHRWRSRVLGVTLLAAAAGSTGGLVMLTSYARPTDAGYRTRGSLLSASVTPQRADRITTTGRALHARATVPTRQVHPTGASVSSVASGANAAETASVGTATAASVVPSNTAVTIAPAHPRVGEFGFER